MALAFFCLLFFTACRTTPTLARFEFQKPEMGVPFRIVLYAPDEATAVAAAKAGFERIRQLNQVFSDYESDSELTLLSRTAGTGKDVPVSDELWPLLSYAQELAQRTDGAFDVTVGPIVGIWRKARRVQQLPPPDVIADFLRPVGYRKLILDPQRHTARLTVPGMKLDLGSIAKSYAAGEAVKTLRGLGIKSAMVAGSGDLTVSDPPPGKKGWRIEIAPLDVSNAPPARFVLLRNQALATSGDVFQHVSINGKRYSHIVNPHTGLGITDHSLVTVIAPTGLIANGLTTSASVLGPALGMRLIEETPGAAGRIARQPDTKPELYESTRFRKYVVE